MTKPLVSVKKICQAGHTVVFDDEGSFIVNKNTGEVNWLREEDGKLHVGRVDTTSTARIQ